MISLDDYDFDLPSELIATFPAKERTQSRLLLVQEKAMEHHIFHELPELLEQEVGEKAVLVVNNTKVIPARLFAHKYPSGGKVELLLCEPVPCKNTDSRSSELTWQESWRCLCRPSKSLQSGMKLIIHGEDPPQATITENEGNGNVIISFSGTHSGGFLETLSRIGHIPLPPYIEKERQQTLSSNLSAHLQNDPTRYQTVFAKHKGAVAAPTAGLHFSEELFTRLSQKGIDTVPITLHVGPGTFAPIKTNDITTHVMHSERYHITEETAHFLKTARAQGRKIVAVGTTVVRTLESATPLGAKSPEAGFGETRLFIYPPYRFQAVDALITNFHLPRSTLLLLVAAFAGKNRLFAAYREAMLQKYRFFSYGDAMLIPTIMEDSLP